MKAFDTEKTATYLNDLYFHNKRSGIFFLQAGAFDGKADTANMLFNFNTLKNLGGYVSHHRDMRIPWIQDGMTCSKFIQLNKKIIYSNKIGAYYNYLKV